MQNHSLAGTRSQSTFKHIANNIILKQRFRLLLRPLNLGYFFLICEKSSIIKRETALESNHFGID